MPEMTIHNSKYQRKHWNPNLKLTIARTCLWLVSYWVPMHRALTEIVTKRKRSNVECIRESWNWRAYHLTKPSYRSAITIYKNIPASQTSNFYSKLMTEQSSSAFSDWVSTNRSAPRSWKLHTGKCKLGGAAPWWRRRSKICDQNSFGQRRPSQCEARRVK